MGFKKELEESKTSSELKINELKQKYAKQIDALNDQIDQLKRLKHQVSIAYFICNVVFIQLNIFA